MTQHACRSISAAAVHTTITQSTAGLRRRSSFGLVVIDPSWSRPGGRLSLPPQIQSWGEVCGCSWDGVAYGSLGNPGRFRPFSFPSHVSGMRSFVLTLCAVWSAGGVRVVCRVRLRSGCGGGGGGVRQESLRESPSWRGLLFVCVHRRVSCRRSIPVGPYSCRRQPLIGYSLRFSHGIG